MENQDLIKQVTAKAEKWLTPAYDAETQAEVRRMLENEDKTELIDSFYKDLEFGTGGLRGIMGAGSNRMNIYTVGAATQGLANYLNKCFAGHGQISVVVGHDCRNNSRKFAEISAEIFSANGIKVYLFDDLRPTPEVSFAIRHLGCQSGINITASHNPREYNGYKAYWEDGAQVLAPHDTGIIEEVNKVTVDDIKFDGNKDLIQIIGEDVDKVYLEKVHSISIDPEVIRRQKDLCIVYTPLHGAGRTLIPWSLKVWGFENVHCVPEQMVKDGNCTTVVSPNPEYAEALTLAVNLAKQINADIVMASDPDADRVGMACKNDKGEWVLINGNQTCLIFLYYIIKNRIATGKMKPSDFIVKTIVTTDLIKAVADRSAPRATGSGLVYSNYSTKNSLIELLFAERRREFLFEGKRWFDLVRRSRRDGNTDYLVNQVRSKFSSTTSISKFGNFNAIYWPYNYDELRVNPNLVQNPAYPETSGDSYESTR